MVYLIIVFLGFLGCKELNPETFVIEESEWNTILKYQFRRPAIQLPNYKSVINVKSVLKACETIVRSPIPIDYIYNTKTLTFIKDMIKNQRSSLDEAYY